MKKLICLSIAIILVFSMNIGISVTQASAIYNFYDDFSNGGGTGAINHTGTSLAPYNVFINGGTAGIADIRNDLTDDTNKVMYMSNTGPITTLSGNTNVDMRFNASTFPAFAEKTVLEFKLKMPNVYAENQIEFMLPEFSYYKFLILKNGKMLLANSQKDCGAYVSGKWYTFKIAIIEHTSHTIDYYIDNELVHTTWNIPAPPATYQSRIKIQSATSDSAKPAEIYMDDIKVYTINATQIISSTKVAVGNTFDVIFNNDIKPNEFSNTYVKVYKGVGILGEAVTGLTLIKKVNSLNTYTITFPSDLTVGQNYTISINGTRDIMRNTMNLTHTFIVEGVITDQLSITAVDGYSVDNIGNKVTAILALKVSDLMAKIVTNNPNNKIFIMDAAGETVSGNIYLKPGMKIKITNADETEERTYTIEYRYYGNSDFNSYTDTLTIGKTDSLPQGFIFGSWQGTTASDKMYVQGVPDGIGGNMLKYYLNGSSSQMPLLVGGVATTTAKKILVSEATIKMEDKGSGFTLFYVGARAGGTYYLPAIDFNQAGKIKAFSNEIMPYEVNKWYKIVTVYNFSTDTGKIYINGVLVKDFINSGFFPANQAFIDLQGMRIQKSTGAGDTNPSVSYIDDYKCYEIADYQGIHDQVMSEVDYTVSSNIVNVDSNKFVGEINGFRGMNGQQLKDALIKHPEASIELYDANRNITESVISGNYILVTSPNERISKQYILNFEMNLGNIQFFFNGEKNNNEYAKGVVTARVDVESFEKSSKVILLIAQYKGDQLIGLQLNEKTIEKVGDYIECSYTVTDDADDTKIKCMLWDGLSTIQPFNGEITATPFSDTEV